jgi:hypothetical protein
MSTGESPPPAKKRPFWRRFEGPDPESNIPRGAIIIVVVGIVACIAAPVLASIGGPNGEAAHLFWVQQRSVADSKPATVPGSQEAKMQLIDGKIQSTGTNVAGYSLFRVLTTLKIDKEAPVSKGRVLCSVHAPQAGTEIAQSSNRLRTTYPRSSEDGIYGQPVPETVLVGFASHGYTLAVLEVGDLPERFTTVEGVKLEWPEYEVGTEHLKYFLPEGKSKAAIELPFYTIWTSQDPPAAQVSCTLETAAGHASVRTAASLPKISPSIDEEAEEATQEGKEEAEEGSAAEETTEPEETEE